MLTLTLSSCQFKIYWKNQSALLRFYSFLYLVIFNILFDNSLQIQKQKCCRDFTDLFNVFKKSFFFETYFLLLLTFVRPITLGLLIQNYFYQIVSRVITSGFFISLFIVSKTVLWRIGISIVFLVLIFVFGFGFVFFRYPNLIHIMI